MSRCLWTPVSDNVAEGQWRYYTVDNPANVSGLQVTLDNLSADIDLYANHGTSPSLNTYACRPYAGGTTAETCTLTPGDGGGVVVGVYGYRSGSFRLTLTTTGTPPLTTPMAAVAVETTQATAAVATLAMTA